MRTHRNLILISCLFVLGASGHVAGTINPVSKDKRSHWTGGDASTALEWRAGATEHPGSWWKHYAVWLAGKSGKKVAAPKAPGNARYAVIEAAPGRYVKGLATT